jgi:hypothetical protein
MARRAQDSNQELTDPQLVAIPHRVVLEMELRIRRRDVGGADLGRKLPSAGDEVVVDVGLKDVADPQLEPLGRFDVGFDVSTWVDDERVAAVVRANQVARMAKPFDEELLELHGRLLREWVVSPGIRAMCDSSR